MIKTDKRIDKDAFWVNGIVLHHFLDGAFIIFNNEYDYKCFSYDNYPENTKLPIRIDNLYELFTFLEGLCNG